MRTVVFDLDGTLLDVLKRYYYILIDYMTSVGLDVTNVDFETYKKLKKKGFKEHQIVQQLLGCTLDIPNYVRYKRENLEEIAYLRVDSLVGDVLKHLESLKKQNYKLILLSQRRNVKNAHKQLQWLSLADYFDEVVFVQPNERNAKLDWMRDRYFGELYIVGDGPLEMECAEVLCGKAFFVDTGLYTIERIKSKCEFCNTYTDAIKLLIEEGNN